MDTCLPLAIDRMTWGFLEPEEECALGWWAVTSWWPGTLEPCPRCFKKLLLPLTHLGSTGLGREMGESPRGWLELGLGLGLVWGCLWVVVGTQHPGGLRSVFPGLDGFHDQSLLGK